MGSAHPGTGRRCAPFRDHVARLGKPVFFTLTPWPEPTVRDYLGQLRTWQGWLERYPRVPAVLTHGFPWRLFREGRGLQLPAPLFEAFQAPAARLQLLFRISLGNVWDYPYTELHGDDCTAGGHARVGSPHVGHRHAERRALLHLSTDPRDLHGPLPRAGRRGRHREHRRRHGRPPLRPGCAERRANGDGGEAPAARPDARRPVWPDPRARSLAYPSLEGERQELPPAGRGLP